MTAWTTGVEPDVGDDPMAHIEAMAAPVLGDNASDVSSDSNLDEFMVCVLHINRTSSQEYNVVSVQYIVIY